MIFCPKGWNKILWKASSDDIETQRFRSSMFLARASIQNLEKKILEILSTTDGKKKLEIDYKNLENSEICTDEKSRDLRFSRNVNLEKIYLYDGPKLQ